MLSLFFISFFLIILGSIVFYTVKYGISPMPSSRKAVEAILANLPPDFHPTTILELGSGWGNLAFPLANRFPQATIIAYEISPVPYFLSKFLQWLFFKKSNLIIKREDFFKASLKEADLIICYLSPEIMQNLNKKLIIESKQPVIIVSNTFAINDLDPFKVIKLSDFFNNIIYFYKK